MTEQVKQYIGGEFAISDSKQWLDVTNPATNEVIAQVPCATESEMNAAIASATETFKRWKEVAAPERARLMLRYQHLLKSNTMSWRYCFQVRQAKPSRMQRVTFGVGLKS